MQEKLSSLIAKVQVWGLPGIANWVKRELTFRIQGKRLLKLAKKTSTVPTRGITVVADINAQTSLSKTTRDFLFLLRKAGIPCQAYDLCLRRQIPACDADSILTPPQEFDLHKYTHIVTVYRAPLPREFLKEHSLTRIVFHDSEHGIHDTMPYIRESGDNIIAMSDFNFNYFKRAFPSQKVFKIPYPFRPSSSEATPRETLLAKYSIAPNDFVVFFNFDYGSYYRKNIPAAIEAFALAFAGDKTAKLLFKSKGASKNKAFATETDELVRRFGIQNQFIHIKQYLSKADVDGLTAACDAYLSLHKSEGFGIGMAEAMSQNKPVVATAWSANTEFCTQKTSWPVPYKMIPILPHEYPVAMKEWAQADIHAAARALQEIRNTPNEVAKRTEAGRKFIEEHYSVESFKRAIDGFLDWRRE